MWRPQRDENPDHINLKPRLHPVHPVPRPRRAPIHLSGFPGMNAQMVPRPRRAPIHPPTP